jgi:dTDP-4-dehydrorhamnose reductase
MRVLVFGSAGLLGSALCATLRPGMEITGLTRALCNVADPDQVAKAVAAYRPDAVVNAAAVPDIHSCESDPARAWSVNALGARNCALAANTVAALHVQISGNIVFRAADHARREWEQPDNPFGVLAATKAAAEGYARAIANRALIIRAASLFGDRPGGAPGGLVGRIRRQAADGTTLRMSTAAINAAYAPDVAGALLDLVAAGNAGAFHLVNAGSITPAGLARAVADISEQHTDVEESNGEAEQRLLACDLARACGVALRPLDDALRAYLTHGIGRWTGCPGTA